MGENERVGERSARGIEFAVAKKNDEDMSAMTLWIGLETHRPLKRTPRLSERSQTESHAGLKLDEKNDAAKFELLKETQ